MQRQYRNDGGDGGTRGSTCVAAVCSMSSRHEPPPKYRAPMQTLNLWRWWLPDLKGMPRPSGWRMTEADAQARHPGCTKVEGSLEIRQFEPDTGHSMPAGLVRRDDGAMMPPTDRAV